MSDLLWSRCPSMAQIDSSLRCQALNRLSVHFYLLEGIHHTKVFNVLALSCLLGLTNMLLILWSNVLFSEMFREFRSLHQWVELSLPRGKTLNVYFCVPSVNGNFWYFLLRE